MDGRARWRVSEGVSDSTQDLSSSVLRRMESLYPQIDPALESGMLGGRPRA